MIPACDYEPCTKHAKYVITPKHGHPADQSMACTFHVGALLSTSSSLGDYNMSWQIDRVIWLEEAK